MWPFSLKSKFEALRRNRSDPIVSFPELSDLSAASKERGWEYQEILPPSIQVCPGARAISEDFLQWVDNGAGLLRAHRHAHRGPLSGRFWAAHLHSVRRYSVDKVFRCALPNATLISEDGGVLTDRAELAREAYFAYHPIRQSQWTPNAGEIKKGRFISLLTSFGDRNIGHFFFDAMLRVALFDELSEYQFLVPPELHAWHRGLLDAVGIKPEQIVPHRNALTRVEELVVCHIARQGYTPRREVIAKFRAKVLENLKLSPPARKPYRRVFTDRSMMKQRRLVNQKELEPMLKERGFEMIRWETLTIAEQASLAMETEIMAGPHGSSLVNCVYCLPGAKMLEIMNPHYWDGSNLRQSTLSGHEFWYTIGENASKDYDTWMDPVKFEKVIDYMIDAPRTDPPLT
jgi:capsular polysaccharide biosynthesis protein